MKPLTIGGLILAALTILIAIQQAGKGLDFVMFYESGQSYNAGGSIYPPTENLLTNLNSPALTVLVFGPLARFSQHTAGVLLVLVNLVVLVASLRIVQRTLKLSGSEMLRLVAVLAVLFPFVSLWFSNTFLWLLVGAFTAAWSTYRQGQMVRAGCWLGLVIAAKPYFAITACLLGWPVMLAAGLTSAGLSLAVMAWTGLGPWLEWHTRLQSVTWIPWTSNASLWGWLVRVQGWGRSDRAGTDALGDVAWLVLALGLLMCWWTWRSTKDDPDRRMFATGAVAILLSPTGWMVYAMLLLGPFVALWRHHCSRWLLLALAGFALPIAMIGWTQHSYWPFITAGSIYFWALLLAWGSIVFHRAEWGWLLEPRFSRYQTHTIWLVLIGLTILLTLTFG